MQTPHGTLTGAEWRVMECLWNRAPQTGREITETLERSVGWSRSTCLTLLHRLEEKQAVAAKAEEGVKQFRPLIRREEAAVQETENFLERVYRGSLSLMVSTLTKKQALSQKEIEELQEVLNRLEEGKAHD